VTVAFFFGLFRQRHPFLSRASPPGPVMQVLLTLLYYSITSLPHYFITSFPAMADDHHHRHLYSRGYAESLDLQDPLRHISTQFRIPSKAHLKANSFHQLGTPP
jgi:hypothetical protein